MNYQNFNQFLVCIICVICFTFVPKACCLFQKAKNVHNSGTIIVTGCSSGIGHETAILLAEKGFHVISTVICQKDAKFLREKGIQNLEPVVLDIRKEAEIKKLANRVEREGLRVVGLVNNAGIYRSPTVTEKMKMQVVKNIFDVNFFGMVQMVKYFTPSLRKTKGRIVNISSVAGIMGFPCISAYSSSKFAIEGFSDCLRKELSSCGVSVSIIEPGVINTPLMQQATDEIAECRNDEDALRRILDLTEDEDWFCYQSTVKKYLVDAFPSYDAAAISSAVPARAIVHALTSTHPKVRYMVGKIDKFVSVKLFSYLDWLFPDSIKDKLF